MPDDLPPALTIKGLTIGAGATLNVSAGATASSITLGNGATESVQAGGTVAGITTLGANASNTFNNVALNTAVGS